MCYIYDCLIQIFNQLQASRLLSDIQAPADNSSPPMVLSTKTSSSSIVSDFEDCKMDEPSSSFDDSLMPLLVPFVHPSIEAGLELVTYTSRPRLTGNSIGIRKLLIDLCAKYVASLGSLFN